MEEESPSGSPLKGAGMRMIGGTESRAQVLLSAFNEAKRNTATPSTPSFNRGRRTESEMGFGSGDFGSPDDRPGTDRTQRSNRMATTSPGSFLGYDTRGKTTRPSTRPGTESSVGGVEGGKELGQKALAPAMQDMVPIKSVPDIYKAVRILVGMVSNCWAGSNDTAANFQQLGTGLARVHVGSETFVVNSYLLMDIEHLLTKNQAAQGVVQDVYIKRPTKYFKHILTLLKMRWVLRFHSACCELDYKMCSMGNLIKGIQTCALQQFAEAACDNPFSSKVDEQMGSHLNLEAVLDDLFDQFQRSSGGSWKNFLQYVSTCDPKRCVYKSAMDLAEAPVVSNEPLMNVCDVIFLSCFLRQRRIDSAPTHLKELVREIEAFGLPIPRLPALRKAMNLRIWAKARIKPTPKDRDRANKKNMQLLAQTDAVVLCAAVEMQLPEVMATDAELAEMDSSIALPKKLAGDASPDVLALTGLGLAAAGGGPPAAKVTFDDKPQISPVIFQACVYCIQHHLAFPAGIRQRLYSLLVDEYGLTRQQFEELAIASTQSIEGERLSQHVLNEMREREKARLRRYEETTYKDCSHLLRPELVCPPMDAELPAKYARAPLVRSVPVLTKDLTRSMPDLRGFAGRDPMGREPFKVPLSTGPLTMDPELGKLRTTGLFIKMPPLKGQD